MVKTTPQRSRIMQAVRQHGTEAELLVRRELYGREVHYRVNARHLAGSPDIVNRKRRFAIFVHGCFWHRHVGCPRSTTPRSNRAFWQSKFRDNVERDKRKAEELRRLGFRVHVVWECDALDPTRLERRVDDIVCSIQDHSSVNVTQR